MNLVQAQGCAHDYGDGKYETLATIFIALAPAAVGAGSLVRSIEAVRNSLYGIVLPHPGAVALIAAAVSSAAGEGALPVHREGRPFARRTEGRRKCMAPPMRCLFVARCARRHRLRLLFRR